MRRSGLTFIVFLSVALLWASRLESARNDASSNEKELTARGERANAKFLKGKDFFAAKKYERAESELNACLEILPDHAGALFVLAQVDYVKGDFAGALVNIEKAETSHAAIAGVSVAIASQRRKALLEERKKKEQEIASLEDIFYSGSCKTDDELLKIPESIEALRREISAINARLNEPPRTEPGELPADYSFVHGNILFKLNRVQEAAGRYLKAIGSDARHAAAYNNLINIFYMSRNYGNALEFIEQAEANGVALNPKLRQAVLQLAKK